MTYPNSQLTCFPGFLGACLMSWTRSGGPNSRSAAKTSVRASMDSWSISSVSLRKEVSANMRLWDCLLDQEETTHSGTAGATIFTSFSKPMPQGHDRWSIVRSCHTAVARDKEPEEQAAGKCWVEVVGIVGSACRIRELGISKEVLSRGGTDQFQPCR
jgi:hypothetical protein